MSPTNGNYVVHAVGRRVFLGANALAATGVQFLDITRNLPNNSRNVQRVALDPIDPRSSMPFSVASTDRCPPSRATSSVPRQRRQPGPTSRRRLTSRWARSRSTPRRPRRRSTSVLIWAWCARLTSAARGRWSRVDIHLPKVPVTDLEFSEQAGVLRAATFGRGVFEFAKPTGPSANLSLQDGLDFETVCPGEYHDLTLEVFNVGSADLTVVNVSSVGSASFSVLHTQSVRDHRAGRATRLRHPLRAVQPRRPTRGGHDPRAHR